MIIEPLSNGFNGSFVILRSRCVSDQVEKGGVTGQSVDLVVFPRY